MTKFLFCLCLFCISLGSAAAQLTTLADLRVSDRGELQLDENGDIYYTPWQLKTISAPGKIGLFMLMPARRSSRKAIAPLKQAMRDRAYDYNRLISTTVVNLDDATFGAGMLVGGELKTDKLATPALHLIVDEDGKVQQALGLQRKQIHVLIHDCKNTLIFQHQGAVSAEQATDIVAQLDAAMNGPNCPSSIKAAQ